MIPKELRDLNQWCCSSSDSKIPLRADTKERAKVDDPMTWSSYDDAVASGAPYVGFVLCGADPYTIIDLDKPLTDEQRERHTKIYEACNSYAELSKSGDGVHIIIKGRIPKGVKRDKVEIYSSKRYIICTGSTINDKPIIERQDLLDALYAEMAPDHKERDLEETPEKYDDAEIIDRASNAENADKFLTLCKGDWAGQYPSQSEADFALLSMLAFYSDSNEQVRRLFRMSALGQRQKAHRNDYLNRCLRKIRGSNPPKISIDELKKRLANQPPPPPPPPEKIKSGIKADKKEPQLVYPPGLVGEIAAYIYSSATRPVPEVGIVGALGLMAGICGRAYNVSGTGLNQYIIFIAPTGSGKEGIANGIDSIISAVRPKVPGIDTFIGPAVIASGQALLKAVADQPCFVSVLGEIGITLQQMSDARATAADKALKRALLDLYGKSGHGKMLRPMAYSDKTKNTVTVHAPSVTVVGESTIDNFFDGLSPHHIAEGLIPRFSIIEYTGTRPCRNKKTAFIPPTPDLIKKVGDLAVIAMASREQNAVNTVTLSDDASSMLSSFDTHCDQRMRSASSELYLQLWNRAHLKALKIASLLAVGRNMYKPEISVSDAEWAIAFVNYDIGIMIDKFKNNLIGTGDNRLESEVKRIFHEYGPLSKVQRMQSYNVPAALAGERNLVPHCYINRRAKRLSVFNNDRRGATRALRETLADMLYCETITQVPAKTAFEQYNTRSPVYLM